MKLKSMHLSFNCFSSSYSQELLMRPKSLTTTLFSTIFILVFISLYFSPNTISLSYSRLSQYRLAKNNQNLAIQEQLHEHVPQRLQSPPPSNSSSPPPEVSESDVIPAVSVLLPAWEVLVIGSRPVMEWPHFCVFEKGVKTPARIIGKLPATNGSLLSCDFLARARQRLPFLEPVVTRFPEKVVPPVKELSRVIMRWNNMAYETISTENDVVVFAKGVNKLQGLDRLPGELRCVFGDSERNWSNIVRTNVVSSAQEVFRCAHPNSTTLNLDDGRPIRVSLEIVKDNLVVPSAAYYKPWRRVEKESSKKLICASTMIYDASKFLREWVMYYSRIGVDKFVLYDNGSDDDLCRVVNELNGKGFNIELVYWIWPKTQEAGFSHSVVHTQDACSWMMYVDVDEFVYSPSWFESPSPSKDMLRSLLPAAEDSSNNSHPVGQVSIRCYEFGPSNQNQHPPEGVTQGYDCRQKTENRHKSIVRLDAVDFSLWNAIHHFKVREREYRTNVFSLKSAVVNHYKYQAWTEFKTKFRRRVSAYVVDWMVAANMNSQDRTPGLGYQPVEPQGWAQKFCEVKDDGLKLLTRKWFRSQNPAGLRMAWQS